MARQYTKKAFIERLQAQIKQGKPIVMAGAGVGICAKFLERGGIDIIGVYNSGKFRMNGYGSLAGMLPIGDANAIVYDMGTREILPQVKEVPVIAGLNLNDITRDMKIFLKQVKEAGFSGIHNFPTVSWFEGKFRETLEDTGFGFMNEIELLKYANGLDLVTIGYAFNPEETKLVVGEGEIDIFIFHAGITRGGSTGTTHASSLEETASRTQECFSVAKSVNPNIILLAHGAALASPEDAQYIIDHTDAVGVQLGSAIERLAIEEPLRHRTEAFKDIRFKTR